MPYSKWSISTGGNFFHNEKPFFDRKVFIIHLDDHHLYSNGLKDCIIPFFPLADIINIQDGYQALSLMKEILIDRCTVDLIITDINHPGLKGDEFLQELRQFENKIKVSRTPAIVISFVDAGYMTHLTRPGVNIIDNYFSKATEPEYIVEAMEEILYAR